MIAAIAGLPFKVRPSNLQTGDCRIQKSDRLERFLRVLPSYRDEDRLPVEDLIIDFIGPLYPFTPKMLGIRAAHRYPCLVTPRRVDRVIGNLSLRAVSAHQQRSNSSAAWHKNAQAGFSAGNDLYNKYTVA